MKHEEIYAIFERVRAEFDPVLRPAFRSPDALEAKLDRRALNYLVELLEAFTTRLIEIADSSAQDPGDPFPSDFRMAWELIH